MITIIIIYLRSTALMLLPIAKSKGVWMGYVCKLADMGF